MITTSNFSICYCELKQRSEMFRSTQHHKQHGVWCHSERSEESLIISSVSQGRSWNFGCCSQSSLRSNHRGFICSTSAIFLLRRQPFSFCSHAIASFTLRKRSSQTSRFK